MFSIKLATEGNNYQMIVELLIIKVFTKHIVYSDINTKDISIITHT